MPQWCLLPYRLKVMALWLSELCTSSDFSDSIDRWVIITFNSTIVSWYWGMYVTIYLPRCRWQHLSLTWNFWGEANQCRRIHPPVPLVFIHFFIYITRDKKFLIELHWSYFAPFSILMRHGTLTGSWLHLHFLSDPDCHWSPPPLGEKANRHVSQIIKQKPKLKQRSLHTRFCAVFSHDLSLQKPLLSFWMHYAFQHLSKILTAWSSNLFTSQMLVNLKKKKKNVFTLFYLFRVNSTHNTHTHFFLSKKQFVLGGLWKIMSYHLTCPLEPFTLHWTSTRKGKARSTCKHCIIANTLIFHSTCIHALIMCIPLLS